MEGNLVLLRRLLWLRDWTSIVTADWTIADSVSLACFERIMMFMSFHINFNLKIEVFSIRNRKIAIGNVLPSWLICTLANFNTLPIGCQKENEKESQVSFHFLMIVQRLQVCQNIVKYVGSYFFRITFVSIVCIINRT